MKLIISIPCYNEEKTLPIAFRSLPKSIPGISSIETMVIDDGSTDATSQVAQQLGITHIIRFKKNRGLGVVFSTAMYEAFRRGADILVNYDADCQYSALDIETIVAPIVQQQADFVVGERPIREIENFSKAKKILQIIGSSVIRKLSNSTVKDTPSGFRALNRDAMKRLHLFETYTYTQESIIAAVKSNLRVVGVPIRINKEVLRQSRLFKNMFLYIFKVGISYLKFYLIYNPSHLFNPIILVCGLGAMFTFVRFLILYFSGFGQGNIQSLILGSILFSVALIALMVQVLGHMLAVNRKMLQKLIEEARESQIG